MSDSDEREETAAPRPKFSFEEETIESLRLQRDALVDALADQISPQMAEWVKSESLNMHVPAIAFRRVKDERDEARKEEGLYYHLFARLRRYLPRIDDMTPDDVAQRLREALADAKADGMEEAAALVPKAAALVLRARAAEMRRAARVDPDAPPREEAMTSNQRPVTPAHCLACKARFRSHDTARACRLCGGTVVAEAECVEEVFAALDASREETAAWSRDLSAMLVRAETAERERDEALAQVKEEAGKDLSAEPAKVEPCGKPFRGPEVAGKSGTFACNRPSGHEGACGQTFAGFFGSPAAEPRS